MYQNFWSKIFYLSFRGLTSTGYGIDLNLGTNSNTVAHFNGGGLCVPTGDATVSSHTSAGGRSIFFNSDNAAEGTGTGRLHINGYFKTFFFEKHPSAECLNFLPFDDAIKLFKESA